MSYHTKLEDVEDALRRNRGLYSRAAAELGITYNSISERVKNHPRLAIVVEEARAVRVDNAEYKLDDAIEAGEPWAVAMVLKTLGKDRGYVERQENQQVGDVTVKVEYVNSPEPAAS